MYDSNKVLLGIIIFLVIFTSPIWYNMAIGNAEGPPVLEYVTDAKNCVENTEWMTANHMNMLIEWRDIVVRDDLHVYIASDGKRYEMSLSHTCMNCHPNKANFCDRCHDYEVVDPNCWTCHVEPSLVNSEGE